MPVDYKRYPKNWKTEIRPAILERAGHKCERCGVPDRAIGYREANGSFVQLADSKANCGMEVENAALGDGRKIVEIVLTIAHLGVPKLDGSAGDKHDKMDCRDENLEALCQRCHLIEDIEEHVQNAATTRARKRRESHVAAGQLELIEA